VNFPRISVIVPAKNSVRSIEGALRSLIAQDYPDFEIILVDDGSTDGTIERVKVSFPSKVKLLSSGGRGPSFARNLGVAIATGEIVAFTDSDCVAEKNWLKELARAFFEKPEAVSVGGTQKPTLDADWFEKKVFDFMEKAGLISDYVRFSRGISIIEVEHNPSCCSAYRKAAFEKFGGFAEELWPGEDTDLDYRLTRAGGKIFWNPLAVVRHSKPRNLTAFSKMMFRYGMAQGLLVRKHGFFRKIHWVPVLMAILSLVIVFTGKTKKNLKWTISTGLFIGAVFSGFDPWVLLLSVIALGFWNCGFAAGILIPPRNSIRG